MSNLTSMKLSFLTTEKWSYVVSHPLHDRRVDEFVMLGIENTNSLCKDQCMAGHQFGIYQTRKYAVLIL